MSEKILFLIGSFVFLYLSILTLEYILFFYLFLLVYINGFDSRVSWKDYGIGFAVAFFIFILYANMNIGQFLLAYLPYFDVIAHEIFIPIKKALKSVEFINRNGLYDMIIGLLLGGIHFIFLKKYYSDFHFYKSIKRECSFTSINED